MTTTGAVLSVMRLSTWDSRWPRGMKTEPGIAPCSNSSASRTSRTIAPSARMRSAVAVSTSRISCFVLCSSYRKLLIGPHVLAVSVRPAPSNPTKLVNYSTDRVVPRPGSEAEQAGEHLADRSADHRGVVVVGGGLAVDDHDLRALGEGDRDHPGD